MCQPAQKRLLASFGMMEAFHGEQFPRYGVMHLIQLGAGHGYLRVGKHRIPAGFLLVKPAPHPLAIGCSSRGGDVNDQVEVISVMVPCSRCTLAWRNIACIPCLYCLSGPSGPCIYEAAFWRICV
jgi:hypothetical protein